MPARQPSATAPLSEGAVRRFQRSMRVTTSDVSLSVAPHLARVRFEQTWSSPKYRDAGPKELLIVAGPRS